MGDIAKRIPEYAFPVCVAICCVALFVLLLSRATRTRAASVWPSIDYTFNVPGDLQESGSMDGSNSPYWWLSSGGEFIITNGIGETMQGDARASNTWRQAYARTNPRDTDSGLHPQNLFRLVSRSVWGNVNVQLQLRIERDNFSNSPNRNSSNGVFLMSRYQDAQTLYYAGVRVDGTAVIKKKYHGTYYTMAQRPLYPGTYKGNRDAVDLLPHGAWFVLQAKTTTNPDGSVTVTLVGREPGSSTFSQIAQATDTGQYNGTPPITTAGYVGIRTDFMDVQFKDITINTI